MDYFQFCYQILSFFGYLIEEGNRDIEKKVLIKKRIG